MKKSTQNTAISVSELIDMRIVELSDRRDEMLVRLRAVIHAADPNVAEEQKWNMPVWSYHGLICVSEAYKWTAKMTFVKDASASDPSGPFNSSLNGSTCRVIDLRKGDKMNRKALEALVQAAIAVNEACAKC